MIFKISTQDGFEYKGLKKFETLEELMNFIQLNNKYDIVINVDTITVMNIGDEDLF